MELEPVARESVPPRSSAEDRPDWSAIRASDMPRTEHRGSTVIVGALAAAAVLLSGAVAVDHLWLSGSRAPAHPAIAVAPSRPVAHPLADAAGRPGAAAGLARSKAAAATPAHPDSKPSPHLAATIGPVAPADAAAASKDQAGTESAAGARPQAEAPAIRAAAGEPGPTATGPSAVSRAAETASVPRAAAPVAARTAKDATASSPLPEVTTASDNAGVDHAGAAAGSPDLRASAGATEPRQPPIAATEAPGQPAAASVAGPDAHLTPAPASPAIPAPAPAAVAANLPAAASAASIVAPPTPTPAPAVPAVAAKPVSGAPVRTAEAAATALPAAAPAAPPAPMVVRFTGDAWIQVLSPAGKVVFSRLMHAGETWTPPAHGLLLTTGNAGATELVVNGVTSPPLGATGAVRHMIPLDPARPAG
jgi:hypothetical protein